VADDERSTRAYAETPSACCTSDATSTSQFRPPACSDGAGGFRWAGSNAADTQTREAVGMADRLSARERPDAHTLTLLDFSSMGTGAALHPLLATTGAASRSGRIVSHPIPRPLGLPVPPLHPRRCDRHESKWRVAGARRCRRSPMDQSYRPGVAARLGSATRRASVNPQLSIAPSSVSGRPDPMRTARA